MIPNATPRGKSHLARSLRGSDCSGVCFCIFVETWTCQTCVGHVPLHVVSDRNQKLSTNRPRSNLLIMHFDAFCTFCTSMFVFFGFLSRQGMLTLLAITARPLVWEVRPSPTSGAPCSEIDHSSNCLQVPNVPCDEEGLKQLPKSTDPDVVGRCWEYVDS